MNPALAPRILTEAAEWFACLADPAAGEAERAGWRAWLAAHPDHAAAWREVETIQRSLAPLSGGAARRIMESVEIAGSPRLAGRGKAMKAIAALLAIAGGALIAAQIAWISPEPSIPASQSSHRSERGEIRALTLADGSKVWLGTQSLLEVTYDGQHRRLVLRGGDLLVQTAGDTLNRPFEVTTAHGRVQALGTRFAVRADPDGTRVDVFQGAVAIAPIVQIEPGAQRTVVHAAEHARFDAGGLQGRGRASAAREAWSRGILLADGLRLDELAAELSRWHGLSIECHPSAASLRAVGAYPLQSLDRSLAALRASLPIETRRQPGGVRIEAREPDPASAPAFTPPRRIE